MGQQDALVIVGAKRTPIGRFQGALSALSAPQLGAHALHAALAQAGAAPDLVDELLLGCVLSAGLKQGPARQAGRLAGLPDRVGATTINKLCGSGMQSVIFAGERILSGSRQLVVAGGMESMSGAPFLLPNMRAGHRLGHTEAKDHLFYDGLEDAESGHLMGWFAEQMAAGCAIGRQQLDDYAIGSLERAQHAQSEGWFEPEIDSVTLPSGELDFDELPRHASAEKIPQLDGVFAHNGRITAANASAISDGAAVLVLTTQSHAEKLGLTPLARLVAWGDEAREPSEFCMAPVAAIEQVLSKANWKANEVDLFEVNEAFALVPLLAMQALRLPVEKVNLLGGACALGHPIGASGARIIVTLLNALRISGGKRGVAAICIGGGEATAVAVERLA